MTDTRANTLLLMLMAIIILLMIAIAGLFLRMNQLQELMLASVSEIRPGTPSQELGLPAGTPAPDFTLRDLSGKPVSLSDFAGKPLLLAFSSTSCSACQQTYPQLQAFSNQQRDLQIVMISRGTLDENQDMVAKQEFAFVVLGWEDAVAKAYQVPGTPFFVAVDGQGVIRANGFANTQAELDRLAGGQ